MKLFSTLRKTHFEPFSLPTAATIVNDTQEESTVSLEFNFVVCTLTNEISSGTTEVIMKSGAGGIEGVVDNMFARWPQTLTSTCDLSEDLTIPVDLNNSKFMIPLRNLAFTTYDEEGIPRLLGRTAGHASEGDIIIKRVDDDTMEHAQAEHPSIDTEEHDEYRPSKGTQRSGRRRMLNKINSHAVLSRVFGSSQR